MHHIRNYEEFPFIDNSLQCNNKNEYSEEATVEKIAAKHQKTSEGKR
jgi:hypothetical protein